MTSHRQIQTQTFFLLLQKFDLATHALLRRRQSALVMNLLRVFPRDHEIVLSEDWTLSPLNLENVAARPVWTEIEHTELEGVSVSETYRIRPFPIPPGTDTSHCLCVRMIVCDQCSPPLTREQKQICMKLKLCCYVSRPVRNSVPLQVISLRCQITVPSQTASYYILQFKLQ